MERDRDLQAAPRVPSERDAFYWARILTHPSSGLSALRNGDPPEMSGRDPATGHFCLEMPEDEPETF